MRSPTRVLPAGAAGIALLATLFIGGSCAQAGRRATLPPVAGQPAPSAPVPPLPPPQIAAAPVAALPAARPAPTAPAAPVTPAPRLFTGWVRIGLATDLESVNLPCCEGELSVDVGGTRLDVASPLRITPAATSVGGAYFRVQVAALKDEEQAKELARRLGGLAALAADARFDAQAGTYRVRLGRFPDRVAAEEAGRRLVRFGVDSFWIVSEGARLGEAALDLSHRGRNYRVAGRSFVLAAPADGGVRWEGKRYRGRLVVFLNDRGRLNLVNELPIEQYLRGVVPRELGPGAYPEIEALKAQAVAARSYTLRNLGEFADEGYDLCGTPRCQVYGGMDDEHPLSNRAVAETAGEVLIYDGQPIDALYSATCGGHTENVEVIFPLKRAPYLRGVPCIEAGEVTLRGGAAVGSARLPRLLLERVLPGLPARLASAAELEQAFVRLARAAGLATPEDHLASLERREVQRFLGSMFDLAADARLFVRPEELGYLVANPPPEWDVADRRLAAFLVESGLLSAPSGTETRMTATAAEDLLLQLALFLRVVEQREASFSSLGAIGGAPAVGATAAVAGRELVAREDGAELHFALPGDLVTFRLEGGASRAGDLVLEAGDVLHLYLVAGGLVAIAQEVDPRGASFDRTHNLSRWTRFRSDSELRASVAGRLPGFDFRTFEVLSRGVSGRVGKIRLFGRTQESAETVDVSGLAVRWTLDLPDTLFTARRLAPAKGEAGWQFSGRGWGHGVGLCQVGSYGMARRGHGYRDILAHYYGGATLQKIAYSGAPAASIAAPEAAR
ncbi:MAG: SpoIID/LytB domain-containing protein [Thermoanaerobaculia bacterium]